MTDVSNVTSGSLTYTYLSDGTKVSAIREDGSGKRYLGSAVYSVPESDGGSETLESAAWDEGRIFFDVEVPVDSTGNGLVVVDSIPGIGCYRDCWYVTDHLGNVRSIVDISASLAAPQVVERNDYLPFGTRLSVGAGTGTGTGAGTGSGDTVLEVNRYRLGGKEEQSFGSLDLGKVDFGARQYDPFTARWTTIDPMAAKYASLSPYSYCAGNPVNMVDSDGRDAIYIAFPDYKANGIPFTGHAGVLLIDNKTGYTKYYEYGRYYGDKKGRVRTFAVPDVKIGKDGKPTMKSLNNVLKKISELSGNHGDIEGAYIKSDEFKEMKQYAEERIKDNENPDREGYSFLSNNCANFAEDVITKDKRINKPFRIINSPLNIVRKYQNKSDATVRYNAKR